MGADFPKAPSPLLSVLVSPFAWLYGRPDLFDAYSAGVLFMQMVRRAPCRPVRAPRSVLLVLTAKGVYRAQQACKHWQTLRYPPPLPSPLPPWRASQCVPELRSSTNIRVFNAELRQCNFNLEM